LQAGATVHLLATSREALMIAGEAIYPVAPLTLPPTLPFPLPATAAPAPVGDAWRQTLLQSEAVRLFIDRACLVQPTFQVTTANAPALAQLCQQLDGLPLALELAAACVKALPVEQIAKRLRDRFRLLRNGPRSAVPRHQTLRATVDWSYDLLTTPERVLLRRLAIFAGGWTVEAAEAVCADDGGYADGKNSAATGTALVAAGVEPNALPQGEILPLLTRLVEKSLVTWDGNQEKARYRLLETIRHYAQEKVTEADETLWLGRRHFAYFLQMARETEGLIQHGQRPLATARLLAEHDNLRAAILWACRHDGEAACHLVGLLRWFWLHADFIVESEGWHQRVLALPAAPTLTPGRALATLSHAALQVYTNQLNPLLLQEAVANFQALNDPVYLCEAVQWLGLVLPFLGQAAEARRLFSQYEPLLRQAATPLVLGNVLVHWATAQSDFAHAQPLYEEALTIGHQWQEPVILAQAYLRLGDWAQGAQDYDRARAYHQEGLAAMRRVGTTWLIATALLHVGTAIGWGGDWAEARTYFDEGLHLGRTVGNERYTATVLAHLGQIAARQGQFAAAERYLTEAVAICRARMLHSGLTLCLIVYAALRYWQGDPARAVRLLALEAVRKTPFLFDVRLREETLAAARRQLTEADFAAAQAAGQTLTVETALVYASAPVQTRIATTPATVSAT
jgi:predicted ATPase